jgi:(p)ppGpp synthase/HD superfamily hydrolase
LSVDKALEIAKIAHFGHFDKAGVDYINHPLAVASMVELENEKIVALLHDVVEDSSFTFHDLEKEGFDSDIILAISLITKKKDDDYSEYLHRVKGNPLARVVKIADLKHNMDLSRLKYVSNKDMTRLNKYKAALEYLSTM